MESPSHAWAIGTIAVVYGYGAVCYKHVVNIVICRSAKTEGKMRVLVSASAD